MTTVRFNQAETFFTSAPAPRVSFAARLASLQVRQEKAMGHVDVAGMGSWRPGAGALPRFGWNVRGALGAKGHRGGKVTCLAFYSHPAGLPAGTSRCVVPSLWWRRRD